ncbi:MAG: YraN family protein, partial [Pseudomonadota bacterium]
GVDSERFVAAFLRAGDYTILATRARVGRAEVDLIVHRDDIVAFVEVKARRDLWSGLDAVTPKKMRQLTRAANAWLAANPSYATCSIRFDIALVSKFHELEYLENAFEFQEDDDFVF